MSIFLEKINMLRLHVYLINIKMEPFNKDKPYNSLPPLPPSFDVETKDVLKACLEATRSLAELKGIGSILPDQSILINSIPLQEAKLSSEIENIVTTQDKLFQANLINESNIIKESSYREDKIDPATKEVIKYRTALKYGYDEIRLHKRSFDLRLIRDICSVLRGKSVDFRDYGANVALANPYTHERRYTPPEGGAVLKNKLDDLEKYIFEHKEHDPLIKMALIHYQFESIHPFDDGNGRTGRIMNILYLVHAGLLDIPVLYLSKYLIENKNEYYKKLRLVTENSEWETWVLYMLKGVTETARITTNRIKQISTLFSEISAEVKQNAPKIYSKDLIESIFKQAYTKVSFLVHDNIAKRQTASIYLQELSALGILEEIKIGREKVYINSRLVDLLR